MQVNIRRLQKLLDLGLQGMFPCGFPEVRGQSEQIRVRFLVRFCFPQEELRSCLSNLSKILLLKRSDANCKQLFHHLDFQLPRPFLGLYLLCCGKVDLCLFWKKSCGKVQWINLSILQNQFDIQLFLQVQKRQEKVFLQLLNQGDFVHFGKFGKYHF